jgi:hypothetical protein
MANKCGGCQLFQGPNQKCGADRATIAGNTAPSNCFKGPASLFSKKICGGCRLFQGTKQKCGGGRMTIAGNTAPNNCYSPIPG